MTLICKRGIAAPPSSLEGTRPLPVDGKPPPPIQGGGPATSGGGFTPSLIRSRRTLSRKRPSLTGRLPPPEWGSAPSGEKGLEVESAKATWSKFHTENCWPVPPSRREEESSWHRGERGAWLSGRGCVPIRGWRVMQRRRGRMRQEWSFPCCCCLIRRWTMTVAPIAMAPPITPNSTVL